MNGSTLRSTTFWNVVLEFADETHTYLGPLRRRAVNGYGLLFTESMNCKQVQPPPDISRILMEL